MPEIEKIITKMGEIAQVEIDGVKDVKYTADNLTSFELIMDSGKRYIVEIKEAI